MLEILLIIVSGIYYLLLLLFAVWVIRASTEKKIRIEEKLSSFAFYYGRLWNMDLPKYEANTRIKREKEDKLKRMVRTMALGSITVFIFAFFFGLYYRFFGNETNLAESKALIFILAPLMMSGAVPYTLLWYLLHMKHSQ